MSIAYKEIDLQTGVKLISHTFNGSHGGTISCVIFANTESSLIGKSYTIMEELLFEIQAVVDDVGLTEKSLKRFFEKELLQANEKLQSLSANHTDVGQVRFHGAIQIFCVREKKYMCSMIGGGSLLVIRNDKVYYMHSCKEKRGESLSLFSDIIEGDIVAHDDFIIFGGDVTQFYTKKQINAFLSSREDVCIPLIESLIDYNDALISRALLFGYSCLVGSSLLFHKKEKNT